MELSHIITSYKKVIIDHMNSFLSIVIPTYNRAEILKENIELMFPKIKEFGLGIYISDDSNNSDTEVMVASLRVKFNYPFFYYEKNTPSLGHDANCISTLKKANSKFVWYLGDSMVIPLDAFDEVMNIIYTCKDDLDFICLNSLNKNNYPLGVVADTHDFIVNNSWHMTLTGITIYNHKVIEWMRNNDFYGKHKNFMQLGIILQYCEQFKAKFYWCGNLIVANNKNKKSYWSNNTISVFASDWWNFIDQFDKLFSTYEKEKVAKSHSLNTYVFGLNHFIKIRANSELKLNLIKKYKFELKKTSKTPFCLIYAVALLPIKPLNYFLNLAKKLKNIK